MPGPAPSASPGELVRNADPWASSRPAESETVGWSHSKNSSDTQVQEPLL